MRLGTKAKLWHRLGQQQRVLTELIERQSTTVDILGSTSDLLTEQSQFIGDIGGLLVDLMADVADLAAAMHRRDIVDRIDARATIAGAMFKLVQQRREEEHGNGSDAH